MEETRSVFRGSQIAHSMRSSGYKNTAYALAEIIDNSVEAQAKHIEVLCLQKPIYTSQNASKYFDMIAVVDDGVGMTVDELWNSLIMGEGTRGAGKGIGKFGFGLPNSSLSQCKTVTVYSWQKPGSVYSAELDIVNLKGDLKINKPQKTKIPDAWSDISPILKNASSGTLVVWSNIDRVQWKKASTLMKNSERIVGRIYRKFISKNKLDISLRSYNSDTGEMDYEKTMLPNDPLYQMVPSNTPEPWNKKKMFDVDGDHLEEKFKVGNHDVIIRCTVASKEAREPVGGKPAGSLPHGRHTNSNLGISIIRADRELYLDTNLCQTYDPLERWWGMEIEFPNELDGVFGVTNNKQDAINFSAMTHKIGAISRSEDADDVDSDDDEEDLRKLVKRIHTRILGMRRTIKNTNRTTTTTPQPGSGSGSGLPPDTDPTPTVTGGQDNLTPEEKLKAIEEALSRWLDPESASAEAKHILDNKLKTVLKEFELQSKLFFDVTLRGGVSIVTLNQDHPAYKHLVKALENIHALNDPKEIKQTATKIQAALNLLFISWAYYENHTINDEEREKLSEVRYDWGKKLSELMKLLES